MKSSLCLFLVVLSVLVSYVLSSSPMDCRVVDPLSCKEKGCKCGYFVGECDCHRCFKCANEKCSFVASDSCEEGYECVLPAGQPPSHIWFMDGTCHPIP